MAEMTNEEFIEWAATDIMGYVLVTRAPDVWWEEGDRRIAWQDFQPTTVLDHMRDVELKVVDLVGERVFAIAKLKLSLRNGTKALYAPDEQWAAMYWDEINKLSDASCGQRKAAIESIQDQIKRAVSK